MGGQINPKIVGATVIGFALVAGAYIISNFGEPSQKFQTASAPSAVETAPRVAIAVTDNDDNGIEDWRDTFVTTETAVTKIATTTYTPPETLTGQTGVSFMENILRSKVYAPVAPTSEEVVSETVTAITEKATLVLYETKDIDIMEDWVDEDIVNYANTFATIVYNNDVGGTDNELDILNDIIQNGAVERTVELQTISDIYLGTKDDALKIPVPLILAKEHLDLINTINALYEDVAALSLGMGDPLLSFVHLKRYTDDAQGLSIALTNMYKALEEHGDLFTVEDPALFFAQFSPDFKP